MKLKENRKLQIVFFVVSMAVLVGIYFPLSAWIENGVVRDKVLKKEVTLDNNVLVDVTSVNSTDEVLTISGWAMRLDAELQGVKLVLIPLNAEESKGLVFGTNLNQSKSLQKYMEYLDVKAPTGSSFLAEVNKKKLQKDVCYELLVYVNYEQEKEETVKVTSKQYLYNEQVYTYNPLEFVAPEFTDGYMSKVVEAGYLLGYTLEHGAWVYQYNGNLYWILDKSVSKNTDENLYMFFHLNTSHRELLPEGTPRYGADNKDFIFQTREKYLESEMRYRVAELFLDVEYPVTYIETGHYVSGENLWVIRNKMEIQE